MNDDGEVTPISAAASFRKKRDNPSTPNRYGNFGFGNVIKMKPPKSVVTIASREHVEMIAAHWKKTISSEGSFEIGNGAAPAYLIFDEDGVPFGTLQFDPDDSLLSYFWFGDHEFSRDASGSAEALVTTFREALPMY